MHRVLVADFLGVAEETSPDDSVFHAAAVMERNNRNPILVRSGGSPVGILTEEDIVAKVLARGIDPRTVRVGDIMEAGRLTVDGGTLLVEGLHGAGSPLHEAEPVTKMDDLDLDSALRRELSVRGTCEACETEQAFLFDVEGNVLCEDCLEDHPDGQSFYA